MDTLSTAHHQVSSLPKIFLSTPNSSNPLLIPLKLRPPSLSTNTTSLLSTKPNQHSLDPLSTFTHPPPTKPNPQTHRKASTGYAAALLDVACCDRALGVVARDARRVKRVVEAVLGDERVEEGKKGEVVRRAVEGGGFYVKLVVMVKMLVAKGKVAAVGEVMEEFGRLWEELCGVRTKDRVPLVKNNKGRRSLVHERELNFAM